VADLAEQARPVQVDALVGDPVAVEGEHRDHGHAERLPRRRLPQEPTGVGAEEVELGDHRVVVGDVHAHVLVALVGEGGPLRAVVRHDGIASFVDLAGGDDLVAGDVAEGRQARVPVVVDLGLEVRVQHREPASPQLLVDHVRPPSPRRPQPPVRQPTAR
jgi:hypothetical protein